MTTFTLAALGFLAALQGAPAAPAPAADLAGLTRSFLDSLASVDWGDLEKLPGTKWGALPPTELTTCLPDGGCYTRAGTVMLGGRGLNVAATGARTIVSALLIRNAGPAIGATQVLEALAAASITATLSRCPVAGGAGGTSWYRLTGANLGPGFLAIQTRCAGRECEGFTLSRGEKLPGITTAQAAMYSESCHAGSERKAIAADGKPHELLAETIRILIPAATTTTLDWAALAALPTGITWHAGGAKPINLVALKNDANPVGLTGSVTLSGREFSVIASGTTTQVKVVYLDEGGMHARGEHMLGVLYQKGFAVRLVRCGPAYTESTHMWYSANSPRTRPAMVLQSIRYEGTQVQDGYAVRLDGTLPARDPRDRNPGSSGC